MVEHISYSALRTFTECPWRFKIQFIDKIRTNSIHTIFGKAIHEACEFKLKDNSVDEIKIFVDAFLRGREEVKTQENLIFEDKEFDEFMEQGKMLAPLVLPALHKEFPGFVHINSEEDLYEPIKEYTKREFKFKGFIDLIIQTPDGKYHIIDYKTCSFGWLMEKKTDAMVTYQLTLYKKFFAQKKGIDEKDIETHFALLKRTAKKDNVEIFRVTSGAKKTANALTVVNNCLKSVDKGYLLKNKLNCTYCPFKKTEHCP